MSLIYLVIGIIVLIVVIGILWQAGALAAGLLPVNPNVRTVLTILMLILLAMIILYFFGSYIPLPRGG